MAVTELSPESGMALGVPGAALGAPVLLYEMPHIGKAGPPLFAVTLVIAGFELSSLLLQLICSHSCRWNPLRVLLGLVTLWELGWEVRQVLPGPRVSMCFQLVGGSQARCRHCHAPSNVRISQGSRLPQVFVWGPSGDSGAASLSVNTKL